MVVDVFSVILSKAIGELAKVPIDIIKDKAIRNDMVVSILKKLNLDTQKLPTDFQGIYIFTLVEFGINKPKAFLDIFKNVYIKKAFQDAFESRNMSKLERECQDYFENDNNNEEFKKMDINPTAYIKEFTELFYEFINKSRTPYQVKTDHQLEDIVSLNEGIKYQIEEMSKGIDEIFSVTDEMKIQSSSDYNILESQLLGLFDAIGYSREDYKVRKENYFEYILNIPKSRGRGYERILFRGIDGEIETSDVIEVLDVTCSQMVDEAWIIAPYRISPAAREKAKEIEEHVIECYTLDELIDIYANFTTYFDWLEKDIKSKGIDKMYIPLNCVKKEVNTSKEKIIAQSHYDQDKGGTDAYINRWLTDPSKKHISILGEFGTGKTWFALHYAWVAMNKYKEAKQNGTVRPRIPLVISLRDYAKAVSLESLFSEFFFRKHKIPLPNYNVFEHLNKMGKLLLIFDGFDEMANKVDLNKMINNFWELAKVVNFPNTKAILTCRTEHFPEATQGRRLLSAELDASTNTLTGKSPQFEVLELKMFNDEQLMRLLSFKIKPQLLKSVMKNDEIINLLHRPIMTEFILDAIPEINEGMPIDLARIYLYATKRKMEKDIKEERTFTSLSDKLFFLFELSFNMLTNNMMSINYRAFPDILRTFFGNTITEEKDIDFWQHDMMCQSMLVRNDEGDYTPFHRSLLEFMLAYKFAAHLGILAEDFVAPCRMQTNIDGSLSPKSYCYSEYFLREMTAEGKVQMIQPLSVFKCENINVLSETVGNYVLTKAVLDFIINMIDKETESVKSRLFCILSQLKNKNKDEIGYLASNIVTLLIKIDKDAFKAYDLSNLSLNNARFSSANLTDSDLHGSDLSESSFTDTILINANLTGCSMKNILDLTSRGWINKIAVANSKFINFTYKDFDFLRQNHIRLFPETKNGDIVITCTLDDVLSKETIKWKAIINGRYILEHSLINDVLYIITINGIYAKININNGEMIETSEDHPLLKWKNCNLQNCLNLDRYNGSLLKLLGATNVPNDLILPSDELYGFFRFNLS